MTATTNLEGPRTDTVDLTIHSDFPSVCVTNLTASVKSDHSAKLQWDPPQFTVCSNYYYITILGNIYP